MSPIIDASCSVDQQLFGVENNPRIITICKKKNPNRKKTQLGNESE